MAGNIIGKIIYGNLEFADNKPEEDYIACEKHQEPKITLVTCSDSRISGHIFNFDTTNYIFCVRNIGNQIKTLQGSVDYGILHLKTPVLLILGHTECGAIKAACSDYHKEPKAIRRELDALKHVSIDMSDKDSIIRIAKLSQNNVDYQVNLAIRLYSLKVNSLLVIGAIFDIHGVYGGRRGEFYIVNLNGEKEMAKIKKSDVFSGIDEKIKERKIRRLV